MKKKWMVSTALLCSAALLVSGCGGKKADGFDAAGYTTAYLDGMIKGFVVRDFRRGSDCRFRYRNR